jgi:hypothetical protein
LVDYVRAVTICFFVLSQLKTLVGYWWELESRTHPTILDKVRRTWNDIVDFTIQVQICK